MIHPPSPHRVPRAAANLHRLLGAALFLVPLVGDRVVAQHDWLKSKAMARGEWKRHAVDYSSNDAAIASNIKQNNNKFARAYQFAQWTWIPGQEEIAGSFYSCGYSQSKKWSADFEYKFRDVKFPSGGIGTQQTCPPSDTCDCECRVLVNSYSIGGTSGTSTTIGTGSRLEVNGTHSEGPGAVSSTMRLQVRTLATDQIVESGEIRLTLSPLPGVAPSLSTTGVFLNAPVSLIPTPTGLVVDLSALTHSTPFGPATHAVEISGESNGSDLDVDIGESPIGLPFDATGSLAAGSLVFFDLAVLDPAGITIDRLDVNTGTTAAGTQGTVEVHVTPSTYVGKQQTPANWALAATGPVLAMGNNLPSPVCLGTGFHLPPGNYGIAVRHVGVALRYTTANPTNQLAETAEVRLAAGQTQTTPFVSAPVANRIFNGNLHYRVGNVPGEPCQPFASVTRYGTGCFARGDSWYENLGDLANFDLAGGLTALAAGPNSYTVIAGAGPWTPPFGAPVLSNAAVPGPMTDDTMSGALVLPFVFPFAGGSTNVVHACVNGFVVLGPTGATTGDFTPTAAELHGQLPRLFALWGDWHASTNLTTNPASGVYFEADAFNQTATITWNDVADRRGGTAAAGQSTVNLQCVLHATGNVEYRYGPVVPRFGGNGNVMAGSSKGNLGGSPSLDLGSRDLSVAMPFTAAGPDMPALALDSNRPILGDTWTLTTTNLEPIAPVAVVLIGDLPIDPGLSLAFLGAPGCNAYTNGNLGALVAPASANGTAIAPITIPDSPALLGVVITAQSIGLSVHSALGLATSNGLLGTLGQ